MAKQATFKIDIYLILQILLAAFLIIAGIQAIQHYNSSLNELKRSIAGFFGQSTSPFALIFAIVEIAAGIALLAALVIPASLRIAVFFRVVVLIFWLVKIVLFTFVGSITMKNDQVSFNPDLLSWLSLLTTDLIILVSLWLIVNKRS